MLYVLKVPKTPLKWGISLESKSFLVNSESLRFVCVMVACFPVLLVNSASLKRSLGTDEFSRKRGGVEEKSLEKDGRPVLFDSTTCRTAGGNPENF